MKKLPMQRIPAKKALSIAVVAVLVLTTGPRVSAADREHQQMMADIRMLQEQAQQLAITLGALNETLRTITTTMNARLDQQAEATRKAFADQKLQVDNMSADIRVIRERVDETNVRVSALDQELEALRAAIPPPGAFPAAPLDPSADPAAPVAAAPAVPPPAGMSYRRMYEMAFADYTAGQYSLAVEGFQAFLRSFPSSDVSDDAQLTIGESHFQAGKFQDAVNAYNQVIQRFAGSSLVPDAYYKRGMAQERLGDVPAARESWQLLIKNFPESDAGRLGKQALDRTNAKKP